MNRKGCTTLMLGVLVATVLAGCAQDVGTIDRSQQNIIAKTDILGKEFYFRMTVIKAPYASGYSTIGDQGRLERGIFEIQEANLHFYRTYEWVQGSEAFGQKPDTDTPLLDEEGEPVTREVCEDGAGRRTSLEAGATCPAGATQKTAIVYVYRGAPLASYPIEAHFDIVREYNPATGEKTNVISENSSDRMWYQRRYMRVDWSAPRVQNFELLMMGMSNSFGPDSVDAAGDWRPMQPALDSFFSIYKGESDEPRYQPRFVRDKDEDGNESGEINYMDFVSHWVMKAATTYYEDWGQYVPLCWFYPWYAGGIFECTTEELTVRTAFMRVDDDGFASRDYDDKDLERFGFFRAERQKYDREYDSTYSGAIRKAFLHPIWERGRDENGDLIPEADRTPKPIEYYLSENYPRELVEGAIGLAAQWSKPFEDAVTFHKGSAPTMFVLCENNNAEAKAAIDKGLPVAGHGIEGAEGYNPICRDMDLPKYNGDLRYNQIHAVTEPQQNGLLGFGPPSADPLTGKIVNSNAYNYVAQMRLYASMIIDVIETLAGVKNLPDYFRGTYIAQSTKAKRVAIQTEGQDFTTGEAIALAQGIVDPTIAMAVQANGIPKSDSNPAQARLDIIKNDPTMERLLVDDSTRMLFRDPSIALGGGGNLNDEQLARMSPRGWMNHRSFMARQKARLEAGERAIDLVEFSDPAIAAVTADFAQRYDTAVCEHFAAIEGTMFDYSVFQDLTADAVADGGTCTTEDATKDVAIDGETARFTCTRTNTANPAEYRWLNLCETVGATKMRTLPANMPKECVDEELGWTCMNVPFKGVQKSVWIGTCPSTMLGKRNAQGSTCQQVDQGSFQGRYWVNTCTVTKLLDQIRERLIEEEGLDFYAYWPPSALYTDSHVPEVAAAQMEMKAKLAELRTEFRDEIMTEMYQAIAVHEVGHTLGLRHNFAASSDALNYPREYWDHKGRFDEGEYRVCNLWSRETRKQQAADLRHLQTSSVMDYGAKFNSEFEGVGHYDAAAIKYGYGNVVEVFAQTPNLEPFRKYLASPMDTVPGNYPVSIRTADEMEELFKRVHYTKIPMVFGTNGLALDAMYARRDVDADTVAPTERTVPYRFCDGDRIGSDPWCWTRDSGADAFEIVSNEMDDYENYDWFFYGYSHESALFWPENYLGRVRSAFYLGKIHYQWWALNYAHFNKDNWWANNPGRGAGPDGEDLAWHEDPNGGLSHTLAAYTAFDTITGAFGRPVPGYFGFNAQTSQYQYVTDYNPENLQYIFRIQEDQGARPMYAGWDSTGYDMYPVHAGAVYDRMAAYEVITDPTSDFLGIDESADTQRYRINFATMFPSQTLNLLGGLLTGRVQGYGWCVKMVNNQPESVKKRSYLSGETCAADEVAMNPEPTDYTFPTTKYRLPMLAAYYGMSMLIGDYDRSFMDVTRIFLKGHASAMEIPEGVESIEYADPLSGKVYVAYKAGTAGEFEPAYYLVSEANRLLKALEDYAADNGMTVAEAYPFSKVQGAVGLLELVRSMHRLYEYSEAN